MEIIIYIILLLLFLFFSWLFGGFETGVISLDRFRLEQEAKKDKNKKRILDFYENGDKTFGTTTLGNTVSNVIIVTISTLLFCEILQFDETYATLITTFTLLIFCEIIPKSLFRDYPHSLVETFYPLIHICYIALSPVICLVTMINKKIKKILKIDSNSLSRVFSKDDLEYIVEETYMAGKMQKPQKEMLTEALDFYELEAKNIMIPRLDIVAIPDTATYQEILKIASTEGYTRYPVYHETLDEITGVLIIYDLLKISDDKMTAKNLQRPVHYAPETSDVNALLNKMQLKKRSMAVIVDSYGGTSGIVTIEDILEEIVGDIEDEYDNEENKDIEKINENTWLLNALVKVNDLCETLDIELPDGEYETIAGLLIDKIARIPSRGQKITIDNYRFEIIEVTNRKIKKVKFTKIAPKQVSIES
jgi:putative hemolysin